MSTDRPARWYVIALAAMVLAIAASVPVCVAWALMAFADALRYP